MFFQSRRAKFNFADTIGTRNILAILKKNREVCRQHNYDLIEVNEMKKKQVILMRYPTHRNGQ